MTLQLVRELALLYMQYEGGKIQTNNLTRLNELKKINKKNEKMYF